MATNGRRRCAAPWCRGELLAGPRLEGKGGPWLHPRRPVWRCEPSGPHDLLPRSSSSRPGADGMCSSEKKGVGSRDGLSISQRLLLSSHYPGAPTAGEGCPWLCSGRSLGSLHPRGQRREGSLLVKSLFASPKVARRTPWKGFLPWGRISLCLPSQM